MTLDKFMQTYKIGGSYSAPDGSYKGQCVSLIKLYMFHCLGVKKIQSIGDAKCYWEKRNSKYIKDNFKPYENTPKFVPKRGDVFVRTSGKCGHVGIVLEATTKYFVAYEQNNGGCLKVKKIKHTDWTSMNFLRPLNQSNIVKSNKPTIKKGDTIELINARAFYKVYGEEKKFYTVSECTKMDYLYKVKFKAGSKFKVVSVNDNWCEITYGTKNGFICYYDKKIDRANVKKV